MKKLVLVFALAFIMAANSFAQTNVVKVNLFSVLIRTGSFFFEHTLDDTKSAQLGFYYTGFSAGETKWRGFGITPEFRYYPSAEAPRGFFLAPFIRYQSIDLSAPYIDEFGAEQEGHATLSTIGGGLLIGNQWLFGDVVSLETFIGPAFNSGSVKVTDGNEESFELKGGINGFGIRWGLTLGVAF